MNNYTEEAKQVYNKVCDKYKHHWLDTTVSQTMAMEMITEALSIANVVGQSEHLCQYESDNTTAMNCKHCGEPKWVHECCKLA